MRRLLKLFKISSRERAILFSSLMWVLIYRIGLWILPFGRTKKWSMPDIPSEPKKSDAQLVAEIVRSVRAVSRFVPQASCLTQALAARRLLEKYGESADLRIGVATDTGKFEAHAWLEIDGRIVLGKQRRHSRYSVLRTGE